MTPKQLTNQLIKLAPRMGKTWATEIVQALSEQTVVVLGTQAASIVLPRLAQQLAALRIQRDEVAKEVERRGACSPTSPGPDQHAGRLITDTLRSPTAVGDKTHGQDRIP